MNNKTCIIIAGPTASGKTTLAIAVAQALNTEIISADSRQCYQELNIGVAKPTARELQSVKHHFINSHSIHQPVNAAIFSQYALDALDGIFKQHNTAVVAGGTGLYIKALCGEMDEMPEVSQAIRDEIRTMYLRHGLAWLRAMIANHNLHHPDLSNPNRLMRSLEIKLSTGRSIDSFYSRQKQKRGFNIIKTGIRLPRAVLYDNINQRVDNMIADGLVDEVRALQPFKHLNALNTVGYKELTGYFEGSGSLPEAILQIKSNTRHYAKRQVTWFNKEADIHWILPDQVKEVLELVQETH